MHAEDPGAPLRWHLSRLAGRLRAHVGAESGPLAPPPPIPPEDPVEQIVAAFDLSPFERDMMLLCAGVELDGELASLVTRAHGVDELRPPTFSLALAALEGPHWSALSPASPLRWWSLIEVGAGGVLTQSPLRLDEWLLHHLVGLGSLDRRLEALLEPVPLEYEPVASHRQRAAQIVGMWDVDTSVHELPIVQLVGADAADQHQLAAFACAYLELGLFRLGADALPTAANELDDLLRLWRREARLSRLALVLDCQEFDAQDAQRRGAVHRFIDRVGTPLVVSAPKRQRLGPRESVSFDVKRPSSHEQREIWRAMLGETAELVPDGIEQLVGQFDLSARGIERALDGALGELAARPPEEVDADTQPASSLIRSLWHSARRQARPGLDHLAQRIEGGAGWDDLILPDSQRTVLRELVSHIKRRTRVWDDWGFADKGIRGLGTAALFAGPSGTGKTLAAEVLANELELDLYRIDLSAVISKYIGETEKNLSKVFRAAEDGGVVLLFDEADALFGKRTEVKDSHDRHANIEVSYLLQRMETYRGLALLTTNLKSALDQAFLRRFRFIVEFPFPGAAQRADIWRRVLPESAPSDELDFQQLSRLNVSGGNIRNIALAAAFLAAEDDEPIHMRHILHAARRELAKVGQPLPDFDLGPRR
ncbi:MAG: ATP-binding protein [Acidobacteriota bacterium]